MVTIPAFLFHLSLHKTTISNSTGLAQRGVPRWKIKSFHWITLEKETGGQNNPVVFSNKGFAFQRTLDGA